MKKLMMTFSMLCLFLLVGFSSNAQQYVDKAVAAERLEQVTSKKITSSNVLTARSVDATIQAPVATNVDFGKFVFQKDCEALKDYIKQGESVENAIDLYFNERVTKSVTKRRQAIDRLLSL